MEIRYVSRQDAVDIDGGMAVVVDVMRAYTTAAWALHNGAERIVLTDDIERAVQIASGIEGALLFKDGASDARFQLHNSPHQLQAIDVVAKTIIQRTNAGTVGAVNAQGADHMFCTGFVTAAATVAAVNAIDPQLVTLVVTGEEGQAEEDLSCAELIASRLGGVDPDPSPFLNRARSSRAASRLEAAAGVGYAGVAAEDVEMCLALDQFSFAMIANNEPDGLTLRMVGEPPTTNNNVVLRD